MAYLYSDQSSQHEQRRHQCTIKAIAAELHIPVDEVAARYEALLIELSARAKVKDYLPVLISKQIHRQYKYL